MSLALPAALARRPLLNRVEQLLEAVALAVPQAPVLLRGAPVDQPLQLDEPVQIGADVALGQLDRALPGAGVPPHAQHVLVGARALVGGGGVLRPRLRLAQPAESQQVRGDRRPAALRPARAASCARAPSRSQRPSAACRRPWRAARGPWPGHLPCSRSAAAMPRPRRRRTRRRTPDRPPPRSAPGAAPAPRADRAGRSQSLPGCCRRSSVRARSSRANGRADRSMDQAASSGASAPPRTPAGRGEALGVERLVRVRPLAPPRSRCAVGAGSTGGGSSPDEDRFHGRPGAPRGAAPRRADRRRAGAPPWRAASCAHPGARRGPTRRSAAAGSPRSRNAWRARCQARPGAESINSRASLVRACTRSSGEASACAKWSRRSSGL